MLKKGFLTGLLFLFLSGCASVRDYQNHKAVSAALERMNQAYQTKNVDAFMQVVSPSYSGNRDKLKLAVENDFAGLVSVTYVTTPLEVTENEEIGKISAYVLFSRYADSARFGHYNENGEVLLKFKYEEDGSLKLTEMPSPPLYGMIIP